MYLQHEGKRTTQLHIVEITIVDQTYCREQYKKSFMHIYNTQICANDRFVEKGSCQVSCLHKALQYIAVISY